MTPQEKQEKMIQEINAVGDCFDQYSLLLVKAGQLPDIPGEKKTDAALVAGCQSKVWLYVRIEQGRIYFDADSDTLIMRGVLQILRELLNGEPASEVSDLDIRLFSETELAATFTSDRNTGLKSILRTIQKTSK